MGNTEILTSMIDEAPELSAAFTENLVNLGVQINGVQEEIDAMLFVMSSASSEIISTSSSKVDIIHTYDGFGSTNATTWVGGDIFLTSSPSGSDIVQFLSTVSFNVSASNADKFGSGNDILFNDSSYGTTQSVITSAGYNGIEGYNITTVTMLDSVVPFSIDTLSNITYVYGGSGWDSDPTITSRVSEFNYAYDTLNQVWGPTGVYGLYEKINHLNTAYGLIQGNKTNVDGRENNLNHFAG